MKVVKKNTNLGTVALAALVGGATGAFISLMLAPKSGKALRQDIQNKAETIIGQVEDTTIKQAEAIKQKSSDLLDKGKKLKEDIHMFIQDLKLKKSDYIDITKTASEEKAYEKTSPPPEAEPDTVDFAPDELPPQDEAPVLY